MAAAAVGRWSSARNYTHSMGLRRHNMWRIQSGYDVEGAEDFPSTLGLEQVAMSQQKRREAPADMQQRVDSDNLTGNHVKHSQVLPENPTLDNIEGDSLRRTVSNGAALDVELSVPWDKLVSMLDTTQQEGGREITDDECQEVNEDVMALMRQLRRVNGVCICPSFSCYELSDHNEYAGL